MSGSALGLVRALGLDAVVAADHVDALAGAVLGRVDPVEARWAGTSVRAPSAVSSSPPPSFT
jgi:hypothetical protein